MKNLHLFIQINCIPFKVIPSRYNSIMPTFCPIVETLVKFDFRNCLQSLLRFGLHHNHESPAQNIFWNGVEWSSWNANSVSKVSNCQSTIFVHWFCNILNVSATGIPFRKQNLMALLCSINSGIVKIEKITFSRLEITTVTIQMMTKKKLFLLWFLLKSNREP